MPEIQIQNPESLAVIKVVGVGGAGGAAVNRMKQSGLKGVEFIVINTDAQALANSLADQKIHIGHTTTRGLGAGADPIVGENAAEESREQIRDALNGADMIFIAAGEGGGTGSGASHIIAEVAKELDILVVGVVSKPFAFEGEKRRRNAEWGIEKLIPRVDTLITVPNDRLLQTIERNTSLIDAFKYADEVLRQGVQGIADLITEHGLINLDFADIRTIMSNAGTALMGIGRASGENRAVVAAQQATESPLLEISIDGARGIIFNVTGGSDLSMHEINEAAEVITSAVSAESNIIFGATIKEDMDGEVAVTVIATGFDASYFHSRPNAKNINKVDQEASEIEEVAYSKDYVSHIKDDTNHKFDDDEIISSVKEDMGTNISDDFKKEQTSSQEQFNNSDYQHNTGNVWTHDEEEEDDDTPAFLRKLRKLKNKK